MKANNSLTEKKPEQSLSSWLGGEKIQQQLYNALSDKKEVVKFTSSLVSAVSTTPTLANCEYASLVSAGLTAHALNLSLSPQLGFCYAVPFAQKEKRDRNGEIVQKACTKAQFVMGYRGYIQLAIRSGEYADLDVMEIHQGEYLGRDAMTGKYKFRFITDEETRYNTPVIGYMAYFELTNGFRKVIYWTKEEMLRHADRYSPAFSYKATDKRVSYEDFIEGKYDPKTAYLYTSFWYTDFKTMAFKTMLRRLISKWGIMSLDLQKAIENDEESGGGSVDLNITPEPIKATDVDPFEKTVEEVTNDPDLPFGDAEKSDEEDYDEAF